MKTVIKSWIKKKAELLNRKLEENILSDTSLKSQVVYGPVKSRRLGNIICINNMKTKVCSYDCIYCASVNSGICSITPESELSPYCLHLAVRKKCEEVEQNGIKTECIVFNGNCEPTLDINLAKEILLLREFGYKIAVFTNSSMLWNYNIRENLMFADYVSIKLDTVNEETWYKLNRPHRKLNFNQILNGIKQFSEKYHGILTTETTLVKNINDSPEEIDSLADFLKQLKQEASYFTAPKYLPAIPYAVSPDKYRLQQICKIISDKIPGSMMLDCPEEDNFFATYDFENELLGLISLHPVTVKAVYQFIRDSDNIDRLNSMLLAKKIKEINVNGKEFFVRNC